jgi:hypothetical protein
MLDSGFRTPVRFLLAKNIVTYSTFRTDSQHLVSIFFEATPGVDFRGFDSRRLHQKMIQRRPTKVFR